MERLPNNKTQEKLAKVFKAVISAGLVAPVFVSVSACGKIKPAVEETQTSATIPTTQETTPPTTIIETAPPTTEIVKVDAPEIPGLTFNQEDKTYLNEAGKVVGAWIEDAVKIEEKLWPAIVLNAETLNKILAENKEKGIFKCPWPFDFQKNKRIEILELFNNPAREEKFFERMGAYLSNAIGIRYSESVGLYAPFDVSAGNFIENIPDEEGPDFYSAQSYRNIGLGNKDLGGFQYNFIDWEPKINLNEAENYGDDVYYQNILSEIKCGDLLGMILPNTVDFNFLDFTNNEEFYKNPGQFQGRLIVTGSFDDPGKPMFSLEKMLKYLNKAGQEVPVGVWSEENTAPEQTN